MGTNVGFYLPAGLLQACRSLLVVVGCLVAFLATGGADKSVDPKSLPAPKRAVVPKLQGPVTVDGDLNEPVWTKAAVLSPFLLNDGSGGFRPPIVFSGSFPGTIAVGRIDPDLRVVEGGISGLRDLLHLRSRAGREEHRETNGVQDARGLHRLSLHMAQAIRGAEGR